MKVRMVIKHFPSILFLFYYREKKSCMEWNHKKIYLFTSICVISIPVMNANYKCLSNIMSHATNIKNPI